MADDKKETFRDEYIKDYKRLTGITDLTGQDVYGALVLMTRKGILDIHGRSLWSKSQWEHLYRKMLDTSNPYNDTIELFKFAVEQTRKDRHKKYPVFQHQQSSTEDTTQEYRAPEEDMETVSKQLLQDDDVFF